MLSGRLLNSTMFVSHSDGSIQLLTVSFSRRKYQYITIIYTPAVVFNSQHIVKT